jgi:hypothetical protein
MGTGKLFVFFKPISFIVFCLTLVDSLNRLCDFVWLIATAFCQSIFMPCFGRLQAFLIFTIELLFRNSPLYFSPSPFYSAVTISQYNTSLKAITKEMSARDYQHWCVAFIWLKIAQLQGNVQGSLNVVHFTKKERKKEKERTAARERVCVRGVCSGQATVVTHFKWNMLHFLI